MKDWSILLLLLLSPTHEASDSEKALRRSKNPDVEYTCSFAIEITKSSIMVVFLGTLWAILQRQRS